MNVLRQWTSGKQSDKTRWHRKRIGGEAGNTRQHAGGFDIYQKLLKKYLIPTPRSHTQLDNIWNKKTDYCKTIEKIWKSSLLRLSLAGSDITALGCVAWKRWTLLCPIFCVPQRRSSVKDERIDWCYWRKYTRAICLFTENLGTEISCCWGRYHQFIGKKNSSFFICTEMNTVRKRVQDRWVSTYHWGWMHYNIRYVTLVVPGPLAQS